MELAFALFGVLALVAGLLVRWRIRAFTRRAPPEVTDEVVRRIEEVGSLETDEPEPLDPERIREEEERFWSETWDRPENLWD